jgi:hypothetical protein
VRERTMEDLRGLIIELVAVDENGKDQLSSLQQPEVQKLRSIFSHQKLSLSDTVLKVRVTCPVVGQTDVVTCARIINWPQQRRRAVVVSGGSDV